MSLSECEIVGKKKKKGGVVSSVAKNMLPDKESASYRRIDHAHCKSSFVNTTANRTRSDCEAEL